ncbi:MAG: 2,3-bisphosphoglycerate-independent phosphoglycerate mutase [Acidimicrobiales bacterium]
MTPAMKYVVCIPDGASDEPLGELGGRTPLEAAVLPVLRGLAARAEVGRAATIPAGMPPGSDVGNMAILGYDPARYHTGRAPIEAAAQGVALDADQVAFRANLVTVGADGTMVDFAGGHPSTPDAARVIADLEAAFGSGRGPGGAQVRFHAGVQYRHLLVAPDTWAKVDCVPPHDLTAKPAVWPAGPAAGPVTALMEASRAVVGASDLAANQIWLWGQGRAPVLPDFSATYGVAAQMVTAVDLVRGLGVLAGIGAVDVEGATGWYDTNYEGKRDAALAGLAEGVDLFVIHVEASDEAGHAGNVEEKVKALENWDSRILGPLIDGLDSMGPWRLLLLPDHATPLALRTHTPDPVPYLLVDSASVGPGGTYSEAGTASSPAVPAHQLMGRLIGR